MCDRGIIISPAYPYRRKRKQAHWSVGAAASALSQTAPQGALHQSAHKWQVEQLSCGY